MNAIRAFLSRKEFLIFSILVIANAWLLFAYKYFPTTDGPAHVYNARLLLDLITNQEQSSVSDFFQLNLSNFTNLSGHLLLAVMMVFVPGWFAQKIFMLLCIVGLPYAFRFFIKQINEDQVGFSLLVFPFTFSHLFTFGFFNFSLGLVFLFWGLGLWLMWLKIRQVNAIGLFSIAAAIFFSHLFVFAVFMLFIGISLIFGYRDFNLKHSGFLKFLTRTITSLALFILLFLFYFFNNTVSDGQSKYLTLYDRVFMIIHCDAVKSFEFGKEGIYTQWIFIGFAILLIHAVYHVVQSRFHIGRMTWIIMISTLCLIGCYFILPNQTGGFVGFISPRFLLLFFLTSIGFFASIKTPVILQGTVALIFILFSALLFRIYHPIVKSENERFLALEDAAKHIPGGAVVVPITQSDHRYHAHFSNALGFEKPIVITENYEATLPYFPVVWNKDLSPKVTVPDNIYALPFHLDLATQKREADFIFVHSPSEDFKPSPPITEHYKLVYSWRSELFLYERNNQK